MITTTSSSSPGALPARRRGRYGGLYLSILSRNLGITVFYFIIQFLFFPLQYILAAADRARSIGEGVSPEEFEYYYNGIGGILTPVSAVVLFLMMLAVPILFSLIQYSYLHQKRSTDVFHALPIERSRMLLINFAASCTMILVPFLVNFIVTCAVAAAIGDKQFSLIGSLVMLFVYTVCTLAALAVAALCAVYTGTVFDNLVYTCGTLYALPVVFLVVLLLIDSLLVGADFSRYASLAYFLSPGTLLVFLLENFDSGYFFRDSSSAEFRAMSQDFVHLLIGAGVWLALAAAVLVLAIWVYRRRKSELAGRTGYNNAIAVGLKLAASFAAGAVFPMVMGQYAASLPVFLLFGLLGGALVYCALECVMSRGFKTLRRAIPAVAAGAALPVVLLLILRTGGLGYETRIPAADSIASVSFNYDDRYGFDRYNPREIEARNGKRTHYAAVYTNDITITEGGGIEMARGLHRALYEAEKADDHFGGNVVELVYRLKNGGTLRRRYYRSGLETRNEIYDRVNANADVLRQLHPAFTLEAADIRSVTLLSPFMTDIKPLSLDAQQVGALIEALRSDMLSETYEQMQTAKPVGFISLTPLRDKKFYSKLINNGMSAGLQLPDRDYDFSDFYALVTETYANTLTLLKAWRIDDFGAVDYSRIDGVYVSLSDENRPGEGMRLNGPEEFNPDTYRAANYDLYQVKGTHTGFTDPARQRQVLDLVQTDTGKAAIPLNFDDNNVGAYFNDSATLEIYISTSDNSNLARPLYADPQTLPEPLLLELRESFERRFGVSWRDRDGNMHDDLFDQVIEAVRASDGEFHGEQGATFTQEAAAVGVIG